MDVAYGINCTLFYQLRIGKDLQLHLNTSSCLGQVQRRDLLEVKLQPVYHTRRKLHTVPFYC